MMPCVQWQAVKINGSVVGKRFSPSETLARSRFAAGGGLGEIAIPKISYKTGYRVPSKFLVGY